MNSMPGKGQASCGGSSLEVQARPLLTGLGKLPGSNQSCSRGAVVPQDRGTGTGALLLCAGAWSQHQLSEGTDLSGSRMVCFPPFAELLIPCFCCTFLLCPPPRLFWPLQICSFKVIFGFAFIKVIYHHEMQSVRAGRCALFLLDF